MCVLPVRDSYAYALVSSQDDSTKPEDGDFGLEADAPGNAEPVSEQEDQNGEHDQEMMPPHVSNINTAESESTARVAAAVAKMDTNPAEHDVVGSPNANSSVEVRVQ
jgi:hypothetical protein